MGKKTKKVWNNQKVSEPEDASVDKTARSYIYDETDEFHNEGYGLVEELFEERRQRTLLPKELTLGIGGNSSEEFEEDESEDDESSGDDNAELMDDDIMAETEEKDDDERKWGTKTKDYYRTDITDERLHQGVNSRGNTRPEKLKIEMEGVKRFQARMQDDLVPNIQDCLFEKSQADQSEAAEEKQQLDVSLPQDQILRTPWITSLLEDFKDTNDSLQNLIDPLYQAKKNKYKIPAKIAEYLELKFFASHNYLLMIGTYLMIYTEGPLPIVKDHPIYTMLARHQNVIESLKTPGLKLAKKLNQLLVQLREGKLPLDIVTQYNDVTDESDVEESADAAVMPKRRIKRIRQKSSSILKTNNRRAKEQYVDSDSDSDLEQPKPKSKKVKFFGKMSDEEAGSDMEAQAESDHDIEEDPDKKRKITEEIQKNKGLTPHRRRDQKNPRVRYKMKYQTKLKKRTSQVKPMKQENKKYDGERTGISSNVVRSRKII